MRNASLPEEKEPNKKISKLKAMLPLPSSDLSAAISKLGIVDVTTATIRQIASLSKELEKLSDEKFVHLELGNPGLFAEKIGVEAECDALRSGIANTYPDISGIPELKKAGSEFIKAYLDLDIPPLCVIPTVGSMQASYTLMTLLKLKDPKRDTILYFDPGFPAQKDQAKVIGLKLEGFDIYDYRGSKLKGKLEEMLEKGNITAMIYSNPNNPCWTNFTDEELKIIGDCATKYDVIVLEDLAYLGMDFRMDCSKPFKAPYVPSVGKFTNNYILMISASKIFSYAGQRIAIVSMSPDVYNKKNPDLEAFFEMPNFGDSYIYGILYTASSGVAHSAQYAMAAMMKKATEGELDFIHHTSEYGRRAARMKDAFLSNGFNIVYEKDGDQNISDGFFFTVGYNDMESGNLQKELLRYGISCISLPCTGSTKNGIRACVSMMKDEDSFERLYSRLKMFNDDHKK